jgi:hypothetical protein
MISEPLIVQECIADAPKFVFYCMHKAMLRRRRYIVSKLVARGVFVTAAICIGLAPSRSIAQDSAENNGLNTTAEALEAAVEEWQRGVELTCTFQTESGFADSWDKGLAGEINQGLRGHPSTTYTATGSFSKKGAKLRMRLDFGAPVIPLEPRSEGGAGPRLVANVSYDEVCNDELEARWHLSGRGLADVLGVAARRKDWQSPLAAGAYSRAEFSPLTPMNRPVTDSFHFSGDTPSETRPDDVSVRNVDTEHIELVLRKKDRGETRTLLFWTRPALPVLERMLYEYEPVNGKPSKTQITLSDFRECTGGFVAARIDCVRQDVSGSIAVEKWSSADLGKRDPTDEDFLIPITAKTEIAGIHNAPQPGSVRRFDLSEYSTVDLVSRDRKASTPGVAQPLQPRANFLWLIVVNVIVLSALLIFYFVRRRRRPT